MNDKPQCTVLKSLRIVRAGRQEYQSLSHFHYRDCNLGPYAAVYAVKDTDRSAIRHNCTAGVIVYTTPAPNLEMRRAALGDVFSGFSDRRLALAMVNRNIRCISRVIIDPRYRGTGLGTMLVRETLKKIGTPIIEAMAVMGRVNPFFEKAGMKAYFMGQSLRCKRLIEAMSVVGVEDDMFIDSAAVHERLCGLDDGQNRFIDSEIKRFLQSYTKRKHMPHGLQRTAYLVSRLAHRPVYYVWINPDKQIQIGDEHE